MQENYLADLMDAEKALYGLISEHSSVFSPSFRLVLQSAYKEIRVEEESEVLKLRKELRRHV
jgi:hypothetical protein